MPICSTARAQLRQPFLSHSANRPRHANICLQELRKQAELFRIIQKTVKIDLGDEQPVLWDVDFLSLGGVYNTRFISTTYSECGKRGVIDE